MTLEEWPPYRFRYGIRFSDEAAALGETTGRTLRIGAAGDASRRNLFGRGLTAGVSSRVDRGRQAVRAFLRIPTLVGLPIETNLFASRRRDASGTRDARIAADVTTFTAEQRFQPHARLTFAYSANLDLNRTSDRAGAGDLPFDDQLQIVRFNGSAVADSRGRSVERHDRLLPFLQHRVRRRGRPAAQVLEVPRAAVRLPPSWKSGPCLGRTDWPGHQLRRRADPDGAVLRGRRQLRARLRGGQPGSARPARHAGGRQRAAEPEPGSALSPLAAHRRRRVRRRRQHLRIGARHLAAGAQGSVPAWGSASTPRSVCCAPTTGSASSEPPAVPAAASSFRSARRSDASPAASTAPPAPSVSSAGTEWITY